MNSKKRKHSINQLFNERFHNSRFFWRSAEEQAWLDAPPVGREFGSPDYERLKERQRKDAEDVAAGRRSARSLLMFQKDDLKGYCFTPNPASEFERSGDGW